MLASLADLKAHLNITSASDDEELQLILDAAERTVIAIAGDWGEDAVTESVPVVGGTAILSRRPSGAVTSGGLSIGGFVDASAGVVTGLGGLYGSASRITVTYPTGGEGVPPEVLLATLIIAGHLWETQRGSAPSALTLQDPNFDPGAAGRGYAIPNRAQELLAPYIRPAVA